jgi:adenosylcobinamide-phosphate synthase
VLAASGTTLAQPECGSCHGSGSRCADLTLGGNARYDGENENRPLLGKGKLAAASDIQRAWQLVFGGTLLWLGIIVLAALFLSGILYA